MFEGHGKEGIVFVHSLDSRNFNEQARKSSKDLWTKMGKTKRYILPSGHLTSHLWFKKFILKKSVEFLK